MIEISGLSFQFEKSKEFFSGGLNLSVGKGEHVSLVGKSGSGKSTLLNIIANLIDPKDILIRGKVSIKGQNPKIRVIFQNNYLFPWYNIFDNIFISITDGKIDNKSAEENRKTINSYLSRINMEGFEKYYPHELSVGMRQRVNFLRAILAKPDILLMDEPFASLDKKNKMMLFDILQDLYAEKEVTSLLVSHSMEEAELLSDRIFDITKNSFISGI